MYFSYTVNILNVLKCPYTVTNHFKQKLMRIAKSKLLEKCWLMKKLDVLIDSKFLIRVS